jgi:hAT family C-terminal dimerisation region
LLQDNAQLYPTLARIALDVLPCQASSVPYEWLFSTSKQTADTQRASLGAKRFEELQIMKFAWRNNIVDLAAWNSGQIEVDLDEYSEMLEADELVNDFDKPEDEFIMEDLD